jgi:hypothetical protein
MMRGGSVRERGAEIVFGRAKGRRLNQNDENMEEREIK